MTAEKYSFGIWQFYIPGTVLLEIIVLCSMDSIISDIFSWEGTAWGNTYWACPAVTISRSVLWQICLVFPIFGKADKSAFPGQEADIGTA